MNSSNRQILNPHSRLHAGCYAIRFTPHRPYEGDDANPDDTARAVREYEGTLRVVHYDNTGSRALTIKQLEDGKQGKVVDISGDLYAAMPWIPAKVHREIPIFPIVDYRFYLLANSIEETEPNAFLLSLRSYELSDRKWSDRGIVVADLRWSEAPEESPSPFDYLEGPVSDQMGNSIGMLTMNWVSNYLRQAVVELDKVNDVRIPLDNSIEGTAFRKWETVFQACGWKLEPLPSDQLFGSSTRIWQESELHQALPALRDSVDLDKEWRYHIFCVGEIADRGRGYEFNDRGTEPNSRLFDSVVLAAKFVFPQKDGWGDLEGKALDETPLYFRTAVHEIGHAMNLEHNFSGTGFMSTTDAIQQAAIEKAKKKGKDAEPDVLGAISWEFARDDQERLRHWPDIVVRPSGGGPSFDLPGIDEFRFVTLLGGADDSDTDTDGTADDLRLQIEPLHKEVPLGAPVRIELKLINRSCKELDVPILRLKSGNMFGMVELPTGAKRQFVPLARPVDDLGLQTLGPRESVTGSLSLLSGPDGPLFPETGPYNVTVNLSWFSKGKFYELSNSTKVLVPPFTDEKHLKVATRLLHQAKETVVSFAIDGDGLDDGNQAINLALNDKTLSPHYAIVRLKQLLRSADRAPGYLDDAFQLLRKKPVLTASEVVGLTQIIVPDRDSRRNESKEQLQSGPELTPQLQTDLQRFAGRIVLGNPSDDTVKILLRSKVKNNGGANRRQITSAKSSEVLETLLRDIGFDGDARNPSRILLTAGRSDPETTSTPNEKLLRARMEKVGISSEDLGGIVLLFLGAVEANPRALSKLDLMTVAGKIIRAFDRLPFNPIDHAKLLHNLCKNLESALVPGVATAEEFAQIQAPCRRSNATSENPWIHDA